MNQRQRHIYRSWLWVAVVFFTAIIVTGWYLQIDQKIPDRLLLYEDQTERLNLSYPFCQVSVNQNEQETQGLIHQTKGDSLVLTAEQRGTYRGEVKLFGLIHYKYIQFDVEDEARVMPVGSAVGLYINTDGLLVLGTGTVSGGDGTKQEPAAGIVQTGDYIEAIDGEKVDSIEEFYDGIQNSGGSPVVLTVRRGRSHIKLKVKPFTSEDGKLQVGIWLREDTEGIGTLTFVTEKNQFAALGHGVTDADTGLLIRLKDGGLYPAIVDHVIQGKSGVPGELSGGVTLGTDQKLGQIVNNTNLGISGIITGNNYSYNESQSLPVGRKQEVKIGKAFILCQLGSQVEKFAIKIVHKNLSSKDNKGMELKVTDRKLLQRAGGIVQGMSGAPIIQGGKVIGAVTHVFVNDPTKGYGIFIENMM